MKLKRKMIIAMSTLVFIIILSVIYILMLHETDCVVEDFVNCIAGNVTQKDVESSELYRYYNRSELYDDGVRSATANVKRIFVWHNFRHGVMFVKYDCEAFDDAGNHIYSSSNVNARWNIKKINGHWIVTDVDEKP